jgi:hypothetical protein
MCVVRRDAYFGFDSRWGYQLVLEKARNHGLFHFSYRCLVTDLVTVRGNHPSTTAQENTRITDDTYSHLVR